MNGLILLTGATGYVGGRLLSRLEERGARVRCLARRPEVVKARAADSTEVVEGDVLSAESLDAALTGVETAYYLVHSMGSANDFEEEDRTAARCFAAAAKRARVKRIVYLGGLGEGERLSPHLASRQEVGRLLRDSGAQVIEFRASIVIGSGSISFEMVRAIVERLPAMVTPKWVRVLAQPIAIEDLLAYLLAVLDRPLGGSVVYEIGGDDRVSYEEIMREYARQRGLRRVIIPVPFLTPRLSSLWLGLITPVYANIGRRLFTSLIHSSVVRDDRALRDFPVRPRGLVESIARALRNENLEYAESRWFDALSTKGVPHKFSGPGTRILDSRFGHSTASVDKVFAQVVALGGENGWPFQWLWWGRGALDLLVGGVGMRRGRPVGRTLRVGDALDFWRVEIFEPGRRLRLLAEMRLPGRAWLEFEVRPDGDGSLLTQTALFEPRGLAGLMYWYALIPAHAVIFRGMVISLIRRAEAKNLNAPMRSFLFLMLLAGCSKVPLDSQPMPDIELSRYMGKWYEIARLPNRFEKGCAGVTAAYALQNDGSVSVLNTCHKDTPQGPARTATAKAWSVDPSNSRFEVSFFRPFKSPYWVIALEPDYRWALVGHPQRSYLWLLSREPKMAEPDEKAAFAEAARLGYDLTRVEKTLQ